MGNRKIFSGIKNLLSIKLGTLDGKMYLGENLIYPIPLGSAVVTCGSKTYNGSEQVASDISVTLNGETLINGVDYTVTSNAGGTNAGSYTVTISGTNYFNGSASGTFTITKANGSVTTAPTATNPTYNGTERVLVTAGEGTGTMLYKLDSGDWGTSIPTATNASTAYTVYYKASASTNYDESVSGSVSCSINKVTPTVTAPVARTLSYNGSAQQLADAGSTDFGTLQYSLDNSTWDTSVPSGTAVGDYTVYYRVVGDSNINDVAAQSITCTIGKQVPVYTAPTAKTGLTYDGSAQALLNAGSTSDGVIEYSSDNVNWGSTIPSGTNAGDYTSYWRLIGDESHSDIPSTSIITTIAKAEGSVISAPTSKTLTYNGSTQELINAGSGTGTMLYKLGSEEWGDAIPTAVNANTAYTVYYKAAETDNYTESASGSVVSSIEKVTPTVTAPTPKTLTYNTSSQVLANEGSTNWGTIQYCLGSSGGTYSATVPSASEANVTYYVWYKVVGDSNVNDVAPASIECMIAERRVTTPTITLDPSSATYDGTAKTPTPTVKDGGIVIPSSEYTVTYENNVNAGTATVVINDKTAGNYYISGSTTFTINRKTITPTITLSQDSYTYNGGQCQPTPTVKDGSTTISSTQYDVSYSDNTNVGTATCTVTGKNSGNYSFSSDKTFTITCYSATGPTSKSLTYNGNPQALVNAGSTSFGTIVYSTDNSSWDTSVPSGTTAGNYTVYWKVTGNTNVCNTSADYVYTSIAKAGGSVTTAPINSDPTYGTGDNLCSAGSGTGTMYYKLGSSGTYSTSIPTANGLNAGSYTVYYYAAESTNYNASSEGSITVTVAKAAGSATVNGVSLTYNGSSRALASVSNNTGTMHYSTDYSSWSTNIPTATDAGSWTIYWYMDSSTNYTGIGSSTSRYVSSSIGKADQSAPTAYGDSVTYGNTATATADGGGGVGYIEWSNGNTLTGDVDSKTTKARWTGDGNYNASPWSNEVTLSITQAQGTANVNGVTLNYNGSSRDLVTVSNNTGTMHYKVDSGSWSTSVPTSTNAGSWTIYWYMDASTNYTGIASSSTRYVSSIIAKIDPLITATPTDRGVTYDGSAQYLLTGGTANVSGTFSYSTGTDAGSYTATWTFTPTDTTNYNAVSGTKTATINKASGSAYATANGWKYDGSYHNVVYNTGGYGTLQYRLEGGSWSTSIPSAINAGTYNCQVYSPGDSNHNEAYSGWYTCTVSKADQPAPGATGSTTTYPTTASATASGGGGQGSIEWESAQSRTSVGSHTTRARWSGNGNYNPSPYSSYVTVQMNKAPGSVAVYGVSLTYNGSSRNLATVIGPTGTMHYSTNYSSWSTTIPTSTNAGSWTIYWYMDASTNYEGISASTDRYVSSSIGKANQSAPTAYGATTTYSTTATATASGGGGQGSIEWSNGNTQTSVGSRTTQARWTGNGNYNASTWSNVVTLTMNKADQSAPTAYGATTTYPTNATATASGGGGVGSLEWSNGATQYSVGSKTTSARWSGDGNYNPSPYSNTVTVKMNKASRSLSWSSAPSSVDVGSTITVSATPSAGSGDGSISYSSSNSNIASVNGSTITGVGAGTCTITASISEGTNYYAASTSYTLSVEDPNFVDLGLPSRTLWAKCNVGASSETGYGKLCSWGNKENRTPGDGYDWGYSEDDNPYIISHAYGLNSNISATNEYDAVYAGTNGLCRMPTKAEAQELLDNCIKTYTNINGVNGFKLTGGNGKSIFLPCVGQSFSTIWASPADAYYYTNTYGSSSSYPWCIKGWSNGVITVETFIRRNAGLPMRGVKNV